MEKTGIEAICSRNPIGAVAIGTGRALEWINILESDLIDSDSIRINNVKYILNMPIIIMRFIFGL